MFTIGDTPNQGRLIISFASHPLPTRSPKDDYGDSIIIQNCAESLSRSLWGPDFH